MVCSLKIKQQERVTLATVVGHSLSEKDTKSQNLRLRKTQLYEERGKEALAEEWHIQMPW